MQNQNPKYIGIVGSRVLPYSYKEEVRDKVKCLLDKGYNIASGGATGTDNFALEALLQLNQSQRGVIFSAWQNIAQFPAVVKEQIKTFTVQGGKIEWGFVPFKACRNAVRAGLLARNIKLVSSASGLVAFLYGQSNGTIFTVLQAVKKAVPVVALLCGNGSILPDLPNGRWKALQNPQWPGAFKVVY